MPYARLIKTKSGDLTRCIEYSNASDKEKMITSFFTSHYLFKSKKLLDYIFKIEKNNMGEYYLTDIINIFIEEGLIINPLFVKQFWRLMGINTQSDIKKIRKYLE